MPSTITTLFYFEGRTGAGAGSSEAQESTVEDVVDGMGKREAGVLLEGDAWDLVCALTAMST